MAEDDECLKAYKADILRRLDALRIPPSRVVIAYQQDLQDYSVLIKGRRLRPKQIEGLAQKIASILHVEFDNPENTLLYGKEQLKGHPRSTAGIIGGT